MKKLSAAQEKLAAFLERQRQKRQEDAFVLSEPGIISFSGGRTSGLMLRKILDHYGGSLPGSIQVVYCNTGKEREETLDFIEECSQRWQTPILWLEYVYRKGLGKSEKHSFRVVDYKTASRKGEPFDMVIDARQDVKREKGEPLILPNQGMRFCTGELKQNTKTRYMRSIGVKKYSNALGIRYDEPRRWMNIHDCPGGRLTGETPKAPLFDAKLTEADVMQFWKEQPFDLGLSSHEGNCDLCFLKAGWKLDSIIREHPEYADWWIQKEKESGAQFQLKKSFEQRRMQLALIDKECSTEEDDYQECHCTD